MTTQNGHCEHCDSDCLGGKVVKRTFGQTVQFQWHSTWGVRWDYECPFCAAAKAERERIVAWLRKQRGWVTMRMSDGYSSTTALEPSDFADAIERGAHLEEK